MHMYFCKYQFMSHLFQNISHFTQHVFCEGLKGGHTENTILLKVLLVFVVF